jgi:hypothetical protein
MKAGNADQFRQLAAGTPTFNMSDVVDRIANLALDGGERQTCVSLECESRQTIQSV